MLWLRCGFDEWHLDCRAGGDIDLSRSLATPKGHDFIAAVKRKGDGSIDFFIEPSITKAFDSNEELNEYLRALGMEEISIHL